MDKIVISKTTIHHSGILLPGVAIKRTRGRKINIFMFLNFDIFPNVAIGPQDID